MKTPFKVSLLLTLALSPFATFAKPISIPQSAYTSLQEKACKLVENIENEGGFYRYKCPSLGGYAIESSGQDMRNWVNVKYGKKTIRYYTANPANIGDKIEWRYTTNGNQKNYHALIYRIFVNQYDEKKGEWLPQEQDKQSLVVIRLAKQKSCILGLIPQSPTMNLQAQQLADNPNAVCKNLNSTV